MAWNLGGEDRIGNVEGKDVGSLRSRPDPEDQMPRILVPLPEGRGMG